MSKANPEFVKCYSANPKTATIAKIIHQIWIGGPLPEKYVILQKTWQELNPDWQYRLWTDSDLAGFPFRDRKRFEKAKNWGEKNHLGFITGIRAGSLFIKLEGYWGQKSWYPAF